MHYKNLNTNGDFNDVTNLESGGESFPTEDEDDVFGIDYEVTYNVVNDCVTTFYCVVMHY